MSNLQSPGVTTRSVPGFLAPYAGCAWDTPKTSLGGCCGGGNGPVSPLYPHSQQFPLPWEKVLITGQFPRRRSHQEVWEGVPCPAASPCRKVARWGVPSCTSWKPFPHFPGFWAVHKVLLTQQFLYGAVPPSRAAWASGQLWKALLTQQLPHEGELPGMKQHLCPMLAPCHLGCLAGGSGERRGCPSNTCTLDNCLSHFYRYPGPVHHSTVNNQESVGGG